MRPQYFNIPDTLIYDEILAHLHGDYELAFETETLRHRQYIDTFDWRLYDRGIVLSTEQRGSTVRLNWENPDGQVIRVFSAHVSIPKKAEDLPTGPFRERIGSLLSNRALLTQATVKFNEKLLNVLNNERKTVAHIVLQTDIHVHDSVQELTAVIPDRVIFTPVLGYGKATKKLESSLGARFSFSRNNKSLLEEGLQSIGRKPGDYSSKVIVDLDPMMETGIAIKKILHALLDVITLNEPGMRADIDVEFLHDFRVAVRRTRTLMGEFKPVFMPSVLDFFRPEFKWLGTITGPTRDLDVYGFKIELYRKNIPSHMTGRLEAFASFLAAHQVIEQQRMTGALDSPRYPILLEKWQAFLETPTTEEETLTAKRPVLDVVSARIWKRYRRAIRLGHVVVSGKNPEAFHILRLVCKKLRYLMELFQSLYPEEKLLPLIRTLKRFQDNLGDIQDYTVQQQMLPQFAAQMTEEGSAPPDTLLAMGWLAGHLNEQQHLAQADFARQFKRFAQSKTQQLFKELFYPSSKPDVSI